MSKGYYNNGKPIHFIDGRSPAYYRKLGFKNFPNYCYICGSKKFLCIHHKDRNRHNNLLKNLQILCKSCHNTIHHNHHPTGIGKRIAKERTGKNYEEIYGIEKAKKIKRQISEKSSNFSKEILEKRGKAISIAIKNRPRDRFGKFIKGTKWEKRITGEEW